MGDRAPFRELARIRPEELLYMEGFGDFMGWPELNIAFRPSRGGRISNYADYDGALHFGIDLQPWMVEAAEAEPRCTKRPSGFPCSIKTMGKKALAGDIPIREVISDPEQLTMP